MNTLLSTVARLLARSFFIFGYKGVGRLFGPLSRIKALRDSEGTARLPGQRKIIFPAFDYYWGTFLWTGRTYEPDVEATFERLRAIPNKVLVDCGANIGYWTVRLSDPSHGYRKFYAIEANQFVFRYLEKNVAANGINCEAIRAAIAERAGETVFLGGSELHAVGAVGSKGVPVPTINLSTVLRDEPPGAVAVVKLDVEGSEIQAIRGAAGLEDVNLIYVYEDWPAGGMQVTAFLLEQGYDVVGIDLNGTVSRLRSVEEAIAFNHAMAAGNHPSNLIGCRDVARFLTF